MVLILNYNQEPPFFKGLKQRPRSASHAGTELHY